MRLGRLAFAGLVTVLLGCATAEEIGDEGVGGAPAGGGAGTGGKADGPGGGGSGNVGGASSGGAAGSGGTSAGGTSSGGTSAGGTSSGGTSAGGTSSGGTSAGGSGGSTSCASGKKMCGGVCVSPNPIVGCTLDTQCNTCPSPPANGTSICSGTLCDFTCNSGFTKSGNACISSGGGGAPSGGGGSTGSGGSSGCGAPCNPSDITSQFLCTFYCATITGKPGLCAPIVNCCACPS